LAVVAPGKEFEHPRITPRAPVRIEKLPIQDRKQPGAQIAFGTFVAPTRQGALQARLHQVVGAAGIARQRQGKPSQSGNDFSQLFVDIVHQVLASHYAVD